MRLENDEKAIKVVRNEEMGILFASKTFQVPHFTQQRIARGNSFFNILIYTPLGHKPVKDEIGKS